MTNEQEQKALEGIAKFLEKMNIPYIFQDIGDEQGNKFPSITCTYRVNEINFDVIIYNIGEWINVKCLIIETEGMKKDDILKIYETCLELNYELPETTFSAYRGNVYVEIDCLVGVDFDDFKGEFDSITEGINAFIEIMENNKEIELKSTKWKQIVRNPQHKS